MLKEHSRILQGVEQGKRVMEGTESQKLGALNCRLEQWGVKEAFKASPRASIFYSFLAICAFLRVSRNGVQQLRRLDLLPPWYCASCCGKHPLYEG
jgi:hypothetical protein